MNQAEASMEYWSAVNKLQEIIDSDQRGSREDILEGLQDDLIKAGE